MQKFLRPQLLIALFLAGCASASAPVAPHALVPSPAPSTPPPPPQPVQRTPLEESELRDQITDWIAQNDQASYAQVAQLANRALRKWGYPFVLNAAPLLGKGQNNLILRAGGRAFELKAGQELSASTELCGERFLRVHAKLVSETKALLVSGGKEFPFSLKPFGREKLKVWRGKRLISVLHLPEPEEPIGLSPDGKAVFLKFPLDERRTALWWSQMARSSPGVLGEDPYLVLRVERGRLSFDTDERNLQPQEFEVASADSDTLRWRFQDLVLELSSRCGDHP